MSQDKPIDASATGADRRRSATPLRSLLLVLPLLLAQAPAAQAQVSVGIGIEVPGVSIGINLPIYPELQRVPGYPVYYAPQAAGNYFYYDGLYWVFQGDHWYASSWYNGPWRSVMPLYVPAYVLRVPVRYYRQPPPYFRHWRADAPPRWDQHWGHEWHQRRPGWNHWDRHAAPPPAPLPTYQRRYPQSRYPQERDRQQMIRAEQFDYKPRETVSRQAYQGPDRSPPHPQGKPLHQAEPRPTPGQPDPRPQAKQPPWQQDRGHDRGRAEGSKPGQDRKGDDRLSDRSPRHQPFKPVQAGPQPRPRPDAQQPPRQQHRPAAAQPSNTPRQQAAPRERGQPQGRAQAS
jgi:hypothetical protein